MGDVLEHAVLPAPTGQLGLDAARIAGDRGNGLVLTLSDGTRVALPEQLRDVLRDAATAIAQGQAVSVTPISTVLTTQQAADLLGVTRPTLVRLLESGKIPFTKPGRHRRVLLEDLKAFQSRRREVRRAALLNMTAEATDQELDAVGFVDTR